MVNLRKAWAQVCKEANLQEVRLHDLRHTAASLAVGQGTSLPIIGRMLGHTQAQTTQRYAHVDIDPVLSAVNAIGQVVDQALHPDILQTAIRERPAKPVSNSRETNKDIIVIE